MDHQTNKKVLTSIAKFQRLFVWLMAYSLHQTNMVWVSSRKCLLQFYIRLSLMRGFVLCTCHVGSDPIKHFLLLFVHYNTQEILTQNL